MDFIFIILGIVLLYFGGDLLVDNASSLARRWGVSSLVVGLTVVSLGTSAPELAASVAAALGGSPELALGNVVGSNVANIALILSVTALIYPLRTQPQVLRRELPVMIGAALLLPLLLRDGTLSRAEGGLFLVLLGLYLWTLLSRRAPAETESENLDDPGEVTKSLWFGVLKILLGLGLLVGGAQFLVSGATSVARGFGVPEFIIGLTLVAIGTSLPELAAAGIAAFRREPDIALGNVVGSNIFNVLFILGVTALVRPLQVDYRAVSLDLWLMIGLSFLLLPLLITGLRLGRREGGVLLTLYLGYVAYLYLA